ncbi:AAA family ATPase [Pseudanabaena biceps]|nr:AAA family ATPase [Pseudanabaena biceps]
MTIKYISDVNAQRYKNLDLEKGLSLCQGLNIFIGSNGSGKSNFIGLLNFLRDSISGDFSLETNSVSSFTKAISSLGDSRILNTIFPTPEKVNLKFTFCTIENKDIEDIWVFKHNLYLSILCSDKKFPQIVEEYLSEFIPEEAHDPDFYYYKFPYESNKYGVIFHADDIKKYTEITNIQNNEIGLSVIPKLLESVQELTEHTTLYHIRRQIINLVSDWRFYSANNMNLKEIRNAEPEIGSPEKYLNPDCENLALVLDNLIQESIDFEDQLNVIMRDIVPQTKRIRPIRTGRTRISIEWHLQNTKRPLYLDEMSDGTVRMLCWAIILNSPNLPSLIVIDEPEVGLHVQWLSYLAEWIKNAAARTQVIITTHSPDLLDKFTDRLENVHVFEASNPEQTLFHVKTLSRERLQDHLDEGWELGDLYRVGEPEVGGWAL